MPPPTPGSTSSIRPTFMATGAVSAWWGGSCASAPARAWWWRQNAAVGWPRTRLIIRLTPCANGRKGAGKTWAFPTIPLTQLHCPPDAVYENDAVFDALDEMVRDGILGAYGVSMETVAQGLRAIERPGVATVQVIFNAFRLKPLERAAARLRKGRCGGDRPRPPGLRAVVGPVHRKYDLPAGRPPDLQPRRARPSTSARPSRACPSKSGSRPPAGWPSRPCPRAGRCPRWRCAGAPTRPGVSTVIPGARSPEQAGPMPPWAAGPACPTRSAALVRATYDEEVRDYVHDRW